MNNGNRRKTKGKQTNKPKQVEAFYIKSEVILIVLFAVSVLLFLSNFGLCGVLGGFLKSVQLGVFGVMGYIAPVLLFVCTCFYLANRDNNTIVMKMTAIIVGLIVLCCILQLLFGIKYEPGMKFGEFYRVSAASGKGGGYLGGTLTALIASVLGTVGTYIILLVALIICAVCITEKSFVNLVKQSSDMAYNYAKEDMDRRKIRHEERVEEKRKQREEQVIRGVNLDSTRITPLAQSDTTVTEPASSDTSLDVDAVSEMEAITQSRLSENISGMLQENKADVFTGKINIPLIDADDNDEVPFDISESIPDTALKPEKDKRTIEEIKNQNDIYDKNNENNFYTTIEDDKGINYDGFFVPDEPKTITTASGKVIETDTEMLRKKLESQKKEAVQNGENVALAVKQQEELPKKEYVFPPISLLKKPVRATGAKSDTEYKATAIKLQQTLKNFGVGVTVTDISCGPSVTRYELHPEQGVKVSKIVSLSDDIKLSLAAEDIRIEAPIPGKSAVGIEVPNKENNTVFLRELLESDAFKVHKSHLAFAVGKDIGGSVVVTDIAKMPHLLIAGATGSGKSVCINTLIMSIIYKSSPEDVKLIMVDPKVVELSVYNGIPHLLIPVVTEPKKAAGALNWAVAEMTDRYKKFADYNVRDLKGYNEKVENIQNIEDENKPKKLPQIVIIVDELADLMMVAPGEVEDAICRLAQLARAAGIHLVIATQRPSVNVITGLIKANVPSRIAFSVSSGVDSRTIIDMNGAEKLLGKGDMLFYPAGFPKPQRIQGAFVSDSEVQKVVDFLLKQGITTDYNPDVESSIDISQPVETADAINDRDEYFIQAGKFIIEKEKASIGMLQRVFKIGFNRAARIMDQLADAGVVGEEEGTKPRKVLMTLEEFEELSK